MYLNFLTRLCKPTFIFPLRHQRIRRLCVESGKKEIFIEKSPRRQTEANIITDSNSGNVSDAKIIPDCNSGNVLVELYHRCCDLIKNGDKNLPSEVIANIPNLCLQNGLERHFMEEILPMWYKAFENNIPNIAPSEFYTILNSLSKINDRSDGDLLKLLTNDRILVIIDLSLKYHIKQEKQFNKIIQILIDFASLGNNEQRFIIEVNERISNAFEAFIVTNLTKQEANRSRSESHELCTMIFSTAKLDILKPSDHCLELVTKHSVSQIATHPRNASKVALNKLIMGNQLTNAFIHWNYDPEEHFSGFWSTYFASMFREHYNHTKLLSEKIIFISNKYNIPKTMMQPLDQILLTESKLEEKINQILSTANPLIRGTANSNFQPLNSNEKLSSYHYNGNQLNKKFNDVDINRLIFFGLPSKYHSLQMDHYFLNKVAKDWVTQVKTKHDSNWNQYIGQMLEPLNQINKSTKGALFALFGRHDVFEFLSELLKTNNICKDNVKYYIMLVTFICENMNIFCLKSANERIGINLLQFLETVFATIDGNEMDLEDNCSTLKSFFMVERTGIQKPSEICLSRSINFFHDTNFFANEENLFLVLTTHIDFYSALVNWNVNADLYCDGFWLNNFKTSLLCYQKLTTQLSADIMMVALHFDQVREFMEFKPYWSKILDEKLLPESKIKQLSAKKRLWSKKNVV